MYDVISFGGAVIDVFAKTELSEKKGILQIKTGSKILINNLRSYIGGGGTNTAVAFSRLGLKTGYIGRIGYGNENVILNILKKEKIDFLGEIASGEENSYSIILENNKNDRTIFTYKGINDDLNFNELNVGKLKTKWLYCSSLLKKSFKTQEKIAGILVKKGTKLAFNPSEYLIKNENIYPMLKLCEVIVLNKDEAKMLTKEKNLLKGLSKLGPKIVVITDKNNPIKCYDSSNNKKYYLKPHNVKVVERTGAGDAFASGFVAGLIKNKSIQESLNLGLKESESVIKHFGAKNGLLRFKLK